MKKLLLLLVAFTLSCTHVAYKTSPNEQLIKSYNLEQQKTVKVGDPIVTLYDGPAYPMYQATMSYIYNPEVPSLKQGDIWIAWLTYDKGYILIEEGSKLLPYKATPYFIDWGLKLQFDGTLEDKPWVRIYTFDKDIFKTSDAGSVSYKNSSQKKWDDDKLSIFSKSEEDYFLEPELFTSELLYTGREKNTVFLLYREYYGRFARESFYQDLRYNIDKSSIITFKTLSIEVIDATNEYITFKILSDGDTPWMKGHRK